MGIWLRFAFSGLLVAASFVGIIGVGSSGARADVNDFTFESMHATYLLGVDETGHSTLTTIEKLVAIFPEADQNRGIQRAIPLDYNGHGTRLQLESVAAEDGTPRAFTTEESDGFLVVTIAAEEYVHGAQTYVLTYTQHDVTLTPSDGGGNQEFYWDVNGTGWSQPFDSVVATVMMPGALTTALTGQAVCYQGSSGVSSPCASLERSALGASAKFTATATGLAAGENLTVAIEFVPGTFIERDTSFFASGLAVPLIALTVLAVGIFILTIILRRTRWRDHPGRGIIVAEYGPPPGMSPLEAATIVGHQSKAVAATVLNLAVSGAIIILDNSEADPGRKAKPRQKDFTLELVDAGQAQADERELLSALFGASLETGSVRTLVAVDTRLSRKLAALKSRVAKATLALQIRGRIGRALPAVLSAVAVVLSLTAFAVALAMGEQEFGEAAPLMLAIFTMVLAVLTFVFSVNVHPLTEKGAALRDHLQGLRVFITLAEADRLRVLQSPTGALRVPVDVADPRLRVKLTEKVLPYAVLFGLEKEWAQELANLYAQTESEPNWYVGQAGFNALAFSAGLNAFATAASTSWSSASSSSSAGGSGGGGFSGGGGGGGGGGGV